ncbi:MAG: 1-deoxy-D-xylulose-5-phosphate reductoisomerase [Chlamydiales bacterium]|nr:1-deoxy-D-xylulose-5-phosphate reductoisomerase [Chlamydiales bacterium]
MVKRISILGSTGSIGCQTLDVVRHLKKSIQVVGLAARKNAQLLAKQIEEFHPEVVAVADPAAENHLRKLFPKQVFCTIEELASLESVDCVVAAIVGASGIAPVLRAIDAGKCIALANKEVLVAAGSLVMQRAKEKGSMIIPVDSEHSALFQCLQTGDKKEIKRLVLTGSGGPFRQKENLDNIKPEDALCHPTWSMGAKITVDSSTLMNKGLEVIEAHVLFDVPLDKIEVVIHPQSVIHSLVEWRDGSLIAQLSPPSMHLPIQYALTYPERVDGMMGCFDFTKYSKLDFYAPDWKRFRCLSLAFEAARTGKSMPCFMNAANEVLVHRFLDGQIRWIEIGQKLETLMEHHTPYAVISIDDIVAVDSEARQLAREI